MFILRKIKSVEEGEVGEMTEKKPTLSKSASGLPNGLSPRR